MLASSPNFHQVSGCVAVERPSADTEPHGNDIIKHLTPSVINLTATHDRLPIIRNEVPGRSITPLFQPAC